MLMLVELCLSIAAVGIAVFLDNAMNYGKALGFIRYQVACLIGSRQKLEELRQNTDFAERTQKISDYYWYLATKKQWFTLLLCRDCLLFWIVVTICLVMSYGLLQFVLILGVSHTISNINEL
jgi:hypothetical protein